MSDLDLNEHHEEIIINYMRFARYQRSQNLKAVEYCFKDVKDSRLLEDTYTSEEVNDILNGLCKVVQTDIETDLINTCHSNVLLLKQLFKQAEKWHLRLQADLSQLENKEMLESIKTLERHEILGIFPDKTPQSPAKVRLQPLSDVHGSMPLLNLEIERLKSENEKLKTSLTVAEDKMVSSQEQMDQLKNNLTRALNQIGDLQKQVKDCPQPSQLNEMQSELAETKHRLDIDKQEALAEHEQLQLELENAKQLVKEAQSQLQLAEQELERKFSETAVYTNMKKMLAKKNEQIKTLRSQLHEFQIGDKEKIDD
ncbi:hypothetical protein R5R35_001756 [Gryllus longicercus]|uniref:Leucine zipper transcription factor-like protein 1 n=1 Tax=Gryllus longicercus TaxID=2509291 RepID=A0AAN9VYC2_9ORTH